MRDSVPTSSTSVHYEAEGRGRQREELAYLAMELLKGETLEAALVRDRVVPPPTVKPFTPDTLMRKVREVCNTPRRERA